MSHCVRSRLKRAVHISAATAVVCILAYISEAVVATVNILTVVATAKILTVVITDARTVALNTPVVMTCVFKPSVVKMVSHSHMFNAVVAEPVLMSVVITMTAVHSPTVSSTV